MFNFSKVIALLSSLLIVASTSLAQSAEQMAVLNNYVELLNESVHGLAVAQILFVNYNKDLNKYVDLESHKINAHITNQELGENIFDNPDITTRDNNMSAMMLSKVTKDQSSILSSSTAKTINGYVTEVVQILNDINDLRFKIDRFIKDNDLNDKENIYKSYVLLEKVVTLFDSYAIVHDKLASRLRKEVVYEYKPMDFTFYEIHTATNSMLQDIRKGSLGSTQKFISRIEGTLDNYTKVPKELNPNQIGLSNEIVSQVKDMVSFIKSNLGNKALPLSYQNYGRDYYLHNSVLLSYYNSISPGFSSKMNKLMSERNLSFLHYDDKPIIYRVTYPEKMQEIEAIATKNVSPPIRQTRDVKEEIVVPAEPQQDYVELEFYDPNRLDRDSITVNFNDDKILDNYMMTYEPKTFKIDIDGTQGNSILILAENEGIISPNTVAFKYRFNGKGAKKTVIIDLKTNQAYELILSIEGLGGFSDDIEK